MLKPRGPLRSKRLLVTPKLKLASSSGGLSILGGSGSKVSVVFGSWAGAEAVVPGDHPAAVTDASLRLPGSGRRLGSHSAFGARAPPAAPAIRHAFNCSGEGALTLVFISNPLHPTRS